LADAGRLSIVARFALSLCETDVRYRPFGIVVGYLCSADGGDRGFDLADQWAAGQPEVPEARDEQTAAAALYGLALDFQDRSQRTEGGLIEGFENAATSLLGLVGTLVIVDDDD